MSKIYDKVKEYNELLYKTYGSKKDSMFRVVGDNFHYDILDGVEAVISRNKVDVIYNDFDYKNPSKDNFFKFTDESAKRFLEEYVDLEEVIEKGVAYIKKDSIKRELKNKVFNRKAKILDKHKRYFSDMDTNSLAVREIINKISESIYFIMEDEANHNGRIMSYLDFLDRKKEVEMDYASDFFEKYPDGSL